METTEIKPGIYENIPFEEYLAWPCFHKSMVGPALRSTAHLKHYIDNKRQSSKFMDFGSLVDCMLLESATFGDNFVERPDTYPDTKKNIDKPWNNNSNYCKEWNAAHSDLTIYSKPDYIRSLNIIQNIQDHETASQWIKGKYQVSIVWKDEETGILCKARIDIAQPGQLNDLKITGDASMNGFRRTFNNFGYHVQAAIYTDGWAALHDGLVLPFGFVVAESEAPHCVATYLPGEDSLQTGKSMFRRAILRYADYIENGPTGYSESPATIEIPDWAVYMEENAEEFDESLLGDTV